MGLSSSVRKVIFDQRTNLPLLRSRLQVAALATAVALSSIGPVSAQNRYSVDGASCDLNSTDTLDSLCPNGPGMPTYGTQAEIMARNPNIASMIVEAANEYGVDPAVALAVSGHEGAMSACAGSFTGVRGPMQLTGRTGRAYGMDRNILSQNIRGGVLVLRAAINACGGTSDVRCLADHYNGSTESQRRNWTNDVTRRIAQMQTTPVPSDCSGRNACIGPGDFPGGGGTAVASAPNPSPSDVTVSAGQV